MLHAISARLLRLVRTLCSIANRQELELNAVGRYYMIEVTMVSKIVARKVASGSVQASSTNTVGRRGGFAILISIKHASKTKKLLYSNLCTKCEPSKQRCSSLLRCIHTKHDHNVVSKECNINGIIVRVVEDASYCDQLRRIPIHYLKHSHR